MIRKRLYAIVFVLVSALTPLTARAAELTVDLSAPFKAVDHAASGALYGIAAPGWPADQWISAIHPKNFTQMAPGGQQLPNGETSPVGDALVVAPIAARHGASVTIRMPDIFPSFPYVWQGAEFWDTEVDRMVAATVAADPGNIYAYEIWNEPDWTWKAEWGDFDAVWAATHARIRALDAQRAIMGPSTTKWDREWMRGFLVKAQETGSVPDIISWHELNPVDADDIEEHVADYRALERELGLGPLPIAINEYGSIRSMAEPGALTRYIAQLERAEVDTANLAFWHRPGRLSDLLVPVEGGRGPTFNAAPTGAFWLFAWYGAMSGDMVATHGTDEGGGLDGFAAFDAAEGVARAVFGGAAGDHLVAVRGLENFGDIAKVQASVTHWTGTDGALPAPDAVFEGRFAITDGAISVPVTLARATDAASLVVTRGDGDLPAGASEIEWEPQPFSRRYEAEDAAYVGARRFINKMVARKFFANKVSGDAYVGFLNRKELSLTYTIEVPEAGVYDLSFGYSNGQEHAVDCALGINGVARGDLNLPPTQARELIGQVHVRTELPVGSSEIVLSMRSDGAWMPGASSIVEFDYLDVTAIDPQSGN